MKTVIGFGVYREWTRTWKLLQGVMLWEWKQAFNLLDDDDDADDDDDDAFQG